ncbi:non-specific lipid transfer protein GPI-anchored 6-like [Tasmannia lanceolata]|uniref:non-specific lipid transfer protein GPI-anchored 6-like n=1 Tax=Tasmannia lanceolata TaxID=3420 RepID=UPI004063C1B0
MATARGITTIGLPLIVVFLLIGIARSDFASDRAECADSIIPIAPCLSYVQGNTRVPAPGCCPALAQALEKSQKCLCILIKDRDAPQLGLTINGTLAVNLPTVCNSSTNVNMTQCIDLLHLVPHSPEAKVFEQFAATTNGTHTTTGNGNSTVVGNSPSNSGGTNGGNSNGGRSVNGLLLKDMIVGFYIWGFVCLVIFGG